MDQKFIDEIKAKLLEAKSRLEAELQNMSEHEELGVDQTDNAEEEEMDMVHSDMSERIKNDLVKITKALDKIDTGTYGIDEDGKQISEERLKALPWADKAI